MYGNIILLVFVSLFVSIHGQNKDDERDTPIGIEHK
jgi:hypothetical protein